MEVAQAATAAGAVAVLVDSEIEVAALRAEGIVASVDGTADIDSHLLYGLPDAAGALATDPVLCLTGAVLSTKWLHAGDAVSYGYTYRASSDTVVALVTGGYAQGIVRALGNSAHAEVGGALRPIVGRVAMDVCVVELGPKEMRLGTEVTYFGGTGPARAGLARWAAVTGCSVAELVVVAGLHARRGWGA